MNTVCYMCKKKINLINFKCKCGNIYCSKHRHFDDHSCMYSDIDKSKLISANPKIIAKKLFD